MLSEKAITELKELLRLETGVSFEDTDVQDIGELLLTIAAQSLKIRARSK